MTCKPRKSVYHLITYVRRDALTQNPDNRTRFFTVAIDEDPFDFMLYLQADKRGPNGEYDHALISCLEITQEQYKSWCDQV